MASGMGNAAALLAWSARLLAGPPLPEAAALLVLSTLDACMPVRGA
jgi:hypothetical protein